MLELEHITVSFGNNVVIDDVSLSGKPGEIIGLVAPNGTGKSTLLNVIMNRVRPQSGKVTIKKDLMYTSEKQKKRIYHELSMMADQHDLYEELSGLEHLLLYKGIWKKSTVDVTALISDLKMDHYIRRKVGSYSLGMRQRLCFAMQLVTDTDIMLMDEVMNGLDPHNVELISRMMVKQTEQGKLIIIASHLLENLEEYANRIFFMQHGKLEEYGVSGTDEEMEQRYIRVKKREWLPPVDWEDITLIGDGTYIIPLINEIGTAKWVQRLELEGIRDYTVGKLSLMDSYKIKFDL